MISQDLGRVRFQSGRNLSQILERFPGSDWSEVLMLDLPKIFRGEASSAPIEDDLEDALIDFISSSAETRDESGCYRFSRHDLLLYGANLFVSRNLLLFFCGLPSQNTLVAACYEYDDLWTEFVGPSSVVLEAKNSFGGELMAANEFSVDEWAYSAFVESCILNLRNP